MPVTTRQRRKIDDITAAFDALETSWPRKRLNQGTRAAHAKAKAKPAGILEIPVGVRDMISELCVANIQRTVSRTRELFVAIGSVSTKERPNPTSAYPLGLFKPWSKVEYKSNKEMFYYHQ